MLTYIAYLLEVGGISKCSTEISVYSKHSDADYQAHIASDIFVGAWGGRAKELFCGAKTQIRGQLLSFLHIVK